MVLLACVVAVQGVAVKTRAADPPCYPPGACANFGTLPVMVPGAGAIASVTSGGPQLVLQSNAVDVETDGGFVISLPTPPPPAPDLPEFAEEYGANSAINKVIAHLRQKIALIEAKINVKKQAEQDHDTWLEQASRAIERVKKQILETKNSRAAIARNLKYLEQARTREVKAVRQAKLAEQLKETQAKLAVLTEQAAAVREAKNAILRARQRKSHEALALGKSLNLHTDALKEKIQLFEDQENELAQIGQTPQNIRHIDGMLQDDEDRHMAEI